VRSKKGSEEVRSRMETRRVEDERGRKTTNPEVSPEPSIRPGEVSGRSDGGNLAGSDSDELISLGLEVRFDVVVVDEVLSEIRILPSRPSGILSLGVVIGEELLVLNCLKPKKKSRTSAVNLRRAREGRRGSS